MSSPTFIFRYFSLPGISETIRLLLTASKVEWTEENPEWPKQKNEQPFGRMPVLIEKNQDAEDFVLCESATIEHYLARRYGFVPQDLKLAAQQEQYRDQIGDTTKAFFFQTHTHGEDKEALYEKFMWLVDKVMEVHSEVLRKNGNNGHYFGNELSYVDMSAYAMVNYFLTSGRLFQDDIFEIVVAKLTPEFKKLVHVVENDPLLAPHFAKNVKLVPLVPN